MNTFITDKTVKLSEMKFRLLASVLFVTTLFTPMFIPVVAQPNHTLECGLDLDERFTYALQREYYADSSTKTSFESQVKYLGDLQEGERFILEIAILENIDEEMNASSSIASTSLPYMTPSS